MVLSIAIALPSTVIAYIGGRSERDRTRRLTASSPGTGLVNNYLRRQSPLVKCGLLSMLAAAVVLAMIAIWIMGKSFNTSAFPGLTLAMLVSTAIIVQNNALVAANRGSGG
ncbi:hypothetical protein [Leifsonia shinshuensis]|uniref:hypothetical protein n=1 Tax=Leifsonia shinshuensis TaxID=150026 RepID=UPI00285DD917|nr:hypothetical protein [Leifsonia shinshuensis]MDR6971371.1 hypothetical protein [Leifsonia shinshuensis]